MSKQVFACYAIGTLAAFLSIVLFAGAAVVLFQGNENGALLMAFLSITSFASAAFAVGVGEEIEALHRDYEWIQTKR